MKGLPSQAPDSLAMHSAVVEAYEFVLFILDLQQPLEIEAPSDLQLCNMFDSIVLIE
jgi:hypothetical protein